MIKDSADLNFYYYISDINLLNKSRLIVEKFIDNANHKIFEATDKFPLNINNAVFIVDNELDFFQEKYMENTEEEKNNIIIVINDILDDMEDYPYEIYISRNRVITSLSAILYDLKNTDGYHKDYFCVEINNINLNAVSPCDLYIQINNDKFLKVVKKEDVFDCDIKNRYQEKSKYLWVRRQHFFLFGNFLYGQDDLEREVNVDFTVENTDHLALIHDMVKSCGISDKTIKTIKCSIENLTQDADKKILSLFDRFKNMEGTFLHAHSYFLSLLSVEVASKQSFFKKKHIDKLVMASLLHDMGYEDEKNALYEALPKSKIMKLDEKTKDDVLGHVTKLITVLGKNNTIDSDIINIIKHHHGARGDESYPVKSFATEMDLLSGLFLLSHAFTVSFFKMSMDPTKIPKILAYINLLYNKGNLKKILPGFTATITDLIGQNGKP